MSQTQFRVFAVLSCLVFAFGVQDANATVTYIVGTCKSGTQFTSISAALAANPAPNIVEVCAATYDEQVVISEPVTLEGIANGSNDAPLIGVPSGGLKVNATDDFGTSVAAQVYVHNVTGVTISNMLIGGKNNGVTGTDLVVGIFYQNSSGTVDHVATRNQANTGNGIGIYLQGGSSNPTVTVENCSIHDFDLTGIDVATNSSTSELTAKITGNSIYANATGFPLELNGGNTVSVTSNNINGFEAGFDILLNGAEGSVSTNNLQNGVVGVAVESDAAITVKSNKIMNTASAGVTLGLAISSTLIEENTIENSPTGIEFTCFASNGRVHTNTIIDAQVGLADVPSGTSSVNFLYVVAAETGNGSSGGCT